VKKFDLKSFPRIQIPQSALQAVSHLLTNPGNTIGQTFNYASPPQQQPPV
jgi:hypothetical protein